MRNVYIKPWGEAPPTYVSVTKLLARLLFEQGKSVTICRDRVNQMNIFKNGKYGITISQKTHPGEDFDTLVKRVGTMIPRELGPEYVYIVKEKPARKIYEQVSRPIVETRHYIEH